MPNEVYWITGIQSSETAIIKIPAVINNKIKITAIYDNTKTKGVFQGNSKIDTIDLLESYIETTGVNCFFYCSNFKNFITSQYLKKICGFPFKYANLNSITLNEGLERIKASAFEDAFSDENSIYIITIPNSIMEIGENAFKVNNKNYRVVLVGEKDSVAEEYCKNDIQCTFIEKSKKIPIEDLKQKEIDKEMSKIFENPKFTYGNYNNTDDVDEIYTFGIPASSLSSSNLEDYSDII